VIFLTSPTGWVKAFPWVDVVLATQKN